MEVIHGVHQLAEVISKSVITIGNFDGVHRGHRVLLQQLAALAKSHNAASVVLTFYPHPMQVLHPEREFVRLFGPEDQKQELARMGIDYLIIEPFSRKFSELDPEQYLLNWIFKPLSPFHIIVGYDFAFGANRAGTIDFLQAVAGKMGVNVTVVPPIKVDGQIVSSSRIRQVLKAGDAALAEELLGRPYYVQGLVEKGTSRGHQIGFPTANLHLRAEPILARGVYAGVASFRGAKYHALTNIGFNPTVVSERPRIPFIETHILDFNDDLYGEVVRFEFLERLREEKKFNSVDELRKQIAQDVSRARGLLHERVPLG